MVPFLSRIFDHFLKWYNFCWGILTLFRLKWYHFRWRFSTLFWNGTIFVDDVWPSSEIVPFLARNCDPFLKWYIFCRGILTLFWLKWYHFCRGFLTLFWNGTIFVEDFWSFSEMLHFVEEFLPFSAWNGAIFVKEFSPFLLRIFDPFLTEMVPFLLRICLPFSEMVLFLLRNFDPFLTEMVLFLLRNFDSFQKWYHFCWGFLTLFWNGSFLLRSFYPFLPVLLTNFDPFLKWYKFRGNLTLFWLKWYYFYWGILTLFRNGIIFVDEILHFSEMVLFLLRIFKPFQIWYHFIGDFWPFSDWNGTIFVEEFCSFSEMVPIFIEEFWHFSEMVPFYWGVFTLFYQFCWRILTLFWNSTIFVEEFWPFSDWNGTIFIEEFWPFSEMVSSLSMKFCTFLKWYYFCWGFLNLFRYGTILLGIFDPFLTEMVLFLLRNFVPFLKWYQFLLRNFDPFLTEMVLFLLRNFDSFQKWYHFCWGFLTLFWNGSFLLRSFYPFLPVLLTNFDPFLKWYKFRGNLTLFWLKWYYFYWGILTLFRNGIIFVDEMVQVSRKFDPFLKWGNGSIFVEGVSFLGV